MCVIDISYIPIISQDLPKTFTLKGPDGPRWAQTGLQLLDLLTKTSLSLPRGEEVLAGLSSKLGEVLGGARANDSMTALINKIVGL